MSYGELASVICGLVITVCLIVMLIYHLDIFHFFAEMEEDLANLYGPQILRKSEVENETNIYGLSVQGTGIHYQHPAEDGDKPAAGKYETR